MDKLFPEVAAFGWGLFIACWAAGVVIFVLVLVWVAVAARRRHRREALMKPAEPMEPTKPVKPMKPAVEDEVVSDPDIEVGHAVAPAVPKGSGGWREVVMLAFVVYALTAALLWGRIQQVYVAFPGATFTTALFLFFFVYFGEAYTGYVVARGGEEFRSAQGWFLLFKPFGFEQVVAEQALTVTPVDSVASVELPDEVMVEAHITTNWMPDATRLVSFRRFSPKDISSFVASKTNSLLVEIARRILTDKGDTEPYDVLLDQKSAVEGELRRRAAETFLGTEHGVLIRDVTIRDFKLPAAITDAAAMRAARQKVNLLEQTEVDNQVRMAEEFIRRAKEMVNARARELVRQGLHEEARALRARPLPTLEEAMDMVLVAQKKVPKQINVWELGKGTGELVERVLPAVLKEWLDGKRKRE